jgi:hypothetical protein
VHDARVQVDLVWVARRLEDLFGLVALLGREDGVGLGGGNGQRPGHGCELVLVDEARMGDISDLDAVLVVPDDVLAARREVSVVLAQGARVWMARPLYP